MPLPDVPAVETAVIEMTNAYRTQNRLGRGQGQPGADPDRAGVCVVSGQVGGVLAHRRQSRRR